VSGKKNIFFLPKAAAFGTKFSLEIVKNLSFLKERFLTVPLLKGKKA